VLRKTQEMTLRVRTTDFVSLTHKQTAKRYPALQKSKGTAGASGGKQVGRSSSLSSSYHHHRGHV
jgi:hypothetical protein